VVRTVALLLPSTLDLSLRENETAMAVSEEYAFLFYTYISIQLIQRQELSTFGLTSCSRDAETKDRKLEKDRILRSSTFFPSCLPWFQDLYPSFHLTEARRLRFASLILLPIFRLFFRSCLSSFPFFVRK
jgi:hypothetical protein